MATSPKDKISAVPGLLASLDLIAKVTSQLLRPTPGADNIVPAILELARGAIAADAYAVWQRSASGEWRIVASFGLSHDYMQKFMPASDGGDGVLRTVIVRDVMAQRPSSDLRDLYISEGIRAYMEVPLTVENQLHGTLAFYYRAVHDFSSEDGMLAAAIAKAEEAVRRSEQELRLLTDTLPALVAYVDKDQRLMRLNKTFEQWFGQQVTVLKGRTLVEVLGPRNYQRLKPHIEGVLEGVQQQFEATNQYVDKTRHVLISYVPDFDDQHQVRGFAALVQDMTEQREARRALEESELRLHKFAEAGPAVLYSNTPDGDCDYVSQRYLDYTGLTIEQALGRGWTSSIHPEDRENVRRTWETARENGVRQEVEFRLCRHDGMYHWFQAWNVPVRDESGSITRWFGTCMDVDNQKRAQEALRKTEKLAAVGRLAASISHEINNPLEAVTNLVYLAKNDPTLSSQVRSYLLTAERELARVSQIATQTLRFYRQTSRPTQASIPELIDSVITLYEGRLANSQIQLERKYSQMSSPVQVFEGELRQVLANLLTNAIDATPSGGRIIIRERECHHWRSGESGVRVTIADTGRGISPEILSRIFEPFFTTKANTGTGLGLWVTREIIDKHGGCIRVRSRQGERSGTVFTFFLPDLMVDVMATA